ncbi:MAG: hypothetical protein HY721_07815 [Planctomycetes bacterium]|nr:hypothetical protein [Planctomycetota bacterium]
MDAMLALFTAALLPPAACALAAPPPEGPLKVTIDAGKPLNPIHPILHGHFLEFMFEGVKGGLHAELLRNRGFEGPPSRIGLPRYWERYPDDRIHDPAMKLAQDRTQHYPPIEDLIEGDSSVRVDIRRDDGRPRGIYQARVPARAGVEHIAHVWVKGEGFQGKLELALEEDRTEGDRHCAAEVGGIGPEWSKLEVRLKPSRGDPLARFAIIVKGKGRIWLDQASLLPGDAPGGVRADVLERIRALVPGFIRWPGGNVAQDYNWRWGVGPRDARPTWTNPSWDNEIEANDFGTDEFIALCREVGAEPSITVNLEGMYGSVEEAAAWVEYANGPADSRGGSLRARNGHPEPYRVKYWELGNEVWGNWVRGHSDAATCAANTVRYAQAMRAVDPSIVLIACGDNAMAWNKLVLEGAGKHVDVLSIHHYFGSGDAERRPEAFLARPLHYERFYGDVEALIREVVPGRRIQLAINEWNTTLPVPRQHSIEPALYAARLMNVFERKGDLVVMSAVSDLVNGWSGGIIQASRHGVFVTPVYHAIQLWREHQGAERIACEGGGPALDLGASRSADGRKVYLKAVNLDLERPAALEVSLVGLQGASGADLSVLAAPSRDAANSFRTPDAVKVQRTRIQSGPPFAITLPPGSAAALAVGAR